MSDTTKSVDDELRRQITEIKDRLAGRIETHRKVAKLSGWTPQELENVIREDGWIFEDEIIALFTKHIKEAEIQARHDEFDRVSVLHNESMMKYHNHFEERYKDLRSQLAQDTKGGTDDTPRV